MFKVKKKANMKICYVKHNSSRSGHFKNKIKVGLTCMPRTQTFTKRKIQLLMVEFLR